MIVTLTCELRSTGSRFCMSGPSFDIFITVSANLNVEQNVGRCTTASATGYRNASFLSLLYAHRAGRCQQQSPMLLGCICWRRTAGENHTARLRPADRRPPDIGWLAVGSFQLHRLNSRCSATEQPLEQSTDFHGRGKSCIVFA